MQRKKPLPVPSTASHSTLPAARKKTAPIPANTLKQAGNRWQRSKRYGWDSR